MLQQLQCHVEPEARYIGRRVSARPNN